ncbi:hypothetical protein [Burkholderia stabilis]|nr:hypothetical protein [Burkholderia stabilis]
MKLTSVNARGITSMRTHQLELFADYFQFYLQDEIADGDLSVAWDDAAVERMLAVTEDQDVIGLGTVRNMHVPVTLEFLSDAPVNDLANFDHVVEGTLIINVGPLVVAGCMDYFPDAARFELEPGTYRVRLSGSGLGTLSEDGLEGQDHYLVQLWPAVPVEPTVLKQHLNG